MKVSQMDLKVKEQQNEKSFYKQKFEQQEEQLKFYREREKDYTIQLS